VKVLVIKMSSLGDLFHALPAVHSLKAGLDAEIDWVVQQEYVDMAECFVDVDHVIPFFRKGFVSNFGRFTKELRASEYDYIIDLQGLLKSAIVARLARGKRRIGPSFHREGAGLFYSAIAGQRDKNRHAVDENMDVVRHLALEQLDPFFPVKFPAVEVSGAHPRVALMPSSRWPTKNWPTERFLEVARRLQSERRASVFLMGSMRDEQACRYIENGLDGTVFNMVGKTGIAEAGGLLREMDLLIANDSGPVHMAVAAGTPVLALFGPTDPSRTGPYGNRNRVESVSLPCRPCFSKSCRLKGMPCLTGVTVDKVVETALSMLA
jgi:heptosyltransferase-1